MLRKILAVDDSALIHQMYKLFLSRYKNCKLISAMNGLEALDKLAQEEGIDLILLDINMPKVDGAQFCRFVKKNEMFKAIKVIFCSGEDREKVKRLVAECGADGFISKDEFLGKWIVDHG
jgi:CheY-like chemotaxis protein